MAEGILRHKAEKSGLKLKVASAGIGNWHVGENPDGRAIQTTYCRGIDISGLTVRQIQAKDFDEFDLILVADAHVHKGVLAIARNETDRKKVNFIMNLLYPDSNRGVPDPYQGGTDSFENVFEMLDEACEAIITKIKNVQKIEG